MIRTAFRTRPHQQGVPHLAYALLWMALVLVPTSASIAQERTIIDRQLAYEVRQRGDSIWVYRDSTMHLEVHRGDSSTRSNFVHGQLRWTVTFVRERDSVRVVSATGLPGVSIPYTRTRGLQTPVVASFNRSILRAVLHNDSLAKRGELLVWDLPSAPERPIEYKLGCEKTMTHHGDTIRVLASRGNPARRDSTVFVLLASDSVRRVWPFPRTFDRHLVRALWGDMEFIDRVRRARADPSLGIRVISVSPIGGADPCPN